MVGRNSIITKLTINNVVNPEKPHEIIVQANKNLGICDIIKGTRIPQEVTDPKTKKKKTIMKFFEVGRVSEVLTDFQGRQINDPDIISALESKLHTTLNPKQA